MSLSRSSRSQPVFVYMYFRQSSMYQAEASPLFSVWCSIIFHTLNEYISVPFDLSICSLYDQVMKTLNYFMLYSMARIRLMCTVREFNLSVFWAIQKNDKKSSKRYLLRPPGKYHYHHEIDHHNARETYNKLHYFGFPFMEAYDSIKHCLNTCINTILH